MKDENNTKLGAPQSSTLDIGRFLEGRFFWCFVSLGKGWGWSRSSLNRYKLGGGGRTGRIGRGSLTCHGKDRRGGRASIHIDLRVNQNDRPRAPGRGGGLRAAGEPPGRAPCGALLTVGPCLRLRTPAPAPQADPRYRPFFPPTRPHRPISPHLHSPESIKERGGERTTFRPHLPDRGRGGDGTTPPSSCIRDLSNSFNSAMSLRQAFRPYTHLFATFIFQSPRHFFLALLRLGSPTSYGCCILEYLCTSCANHFYRRYAHDCQCFPLFISWIFVQITLRCKDTFPFFPP